MKFTVPGQPISKGRHRTAILKQCRRCGKKTCMRVCRCGSEELNMLTTLESPDPDSARYENKVSLFARQALNCDGLMEGPLSIEIWAYFLIPASRACKHHSERPLYDSCKRIHEGDYHTVRPDGDNILKAVSDGLNQIVWPDDSRIAKTGPVWKYYSSVPRVEVEVKQL